MVKGQFLHVAAHSNRKLLWGKGTNKKHRRMSRCDSGPNCTESVTRNPRYYKTLICRGEKRDFCIVGGTMFHSVKYLGHTNGYFNRARFIQICFAVSNRL